MLFFAAATAAANADGESGRIYTSATLASEQRFNGVSNSDGEPVLQASIHWAKEDGLYAGIWGTQVDFDDSADTSLELDTYVGRRWTFDRTELNLEFMYTAFNDAEPGPTYDFLQLKLNVYRRLKRLTLGIENAVSPEGSYGSGLTHQLRGVTEFEMNGWLSMNAMVGRGTIERRPDRLYWEAGVAAELGDRVVLELLYVDTSLNRAQCGFRTWCKPTVVGKFTVRGPSFVPGYGHAE